MTILRTPDSGYRDDPTLCVDGVQMRALWRHQAMVVTIGGDVDAVSGDRVQAFVTGFVVLGNALTLDLSGVKFFAVRGVSVLMAVDDACATAEVPWALVPNRAVSRVLQLTSCESPLPIVRSVPDALRHVTALSEARRRFALATTTSKRHAT